MKQPVFATAVAFVCIAVLSLPLTAANLQELVPVGAKAYGLLDAVLLEAGRVPNTTARPYTIAQFRQMLAWVDPQTLSEAGKAAYQRLIDGLGSIGIFKQDFFLFDTGLTLGGAWYDQTNGTNDFKVADYGKRQSLLLLPLAFGFGDNIFMTGNVDLREEYFAIPRDKFNVPSDIGWFDLQFPFMAYLSVGDEHLNLTIGRTQQSVGPGRFSQMLISDQADFLEYLSLRAAWDPFVYTASFYNMDPSLLPGQSDGPDATRSFYTHRFETSLFDNRINIGVTEGIMVGGLQPELKYFNPLMIFHNYMDWTHASSIFSFEVNLNPFKYVKLYGQYLFNRVPVDYEQRVYGDDENPFGRAYLAGLESQFPIGPGYLGIVAEFYYADPFMFLRESPYVSYVWHRRVLSNVLGNGAVAVVSKPLGYEYGSDAYNLYGRLEYKVTDLVQGGLTVNWAELGQNTIDSTFHRGNAAVQLVTPSGIPEKRLQIGLDLSWQPLDWLLFSGGLDWIHRQNAGHVAGTVLMDLQPSLGVQFSIGRRMDGLQKGRSY